MRDDVARLGRRPDCTVVLTGGAAGVVSGVHAEVRHAGGEGRLGDLAGRNGTVMTGRRLGPPRVLRAGDTLSLGQTGPRLLVGAVAEGLTPTLPERPGVP